MLFVTVFLISVIILVVRIITHNLGMTGSRCIVVSILKLDGQEENNFKGGGNYKEIPFSLILTVCVCVHERERERERERENKGREQQREGEKWFDSCIDV